MLLLKIGNHHVDVPRDVDVPVVLRSPVFTNDEGAIPGSFVFNFSLPYTDQLKRELNFAHRASRKGKPIWQHDSELRFGPLKYFGKATIQNINATEVEFSMPVEVGNLASEFKDLTLQDLDIEDVLPWDPQLCYAELTDQFTFKKYPGFGSTPFTEEIPLEFDFCPVDSFSGYNPETYSFTAPETRDYHILVHLNSFLHPIMGNPQLGLAGKDRKILIKKNGSDLVSPDITSDSFSYMDVLSLNEGDVLTFFLKVSSQNSNQANFLEVTVQQGTQFTIDDNQDPFHDVPGSQYPDKNFAVFPFENPQILENIPESLYRLDVNDIKEATARFSPVVNYYRDGRFPYVISGLANGLYVSLLNMFSPSPYLAFVMKKIFEKINFQMENNVFEGDELKQITIICNSFICNYFPSYEPLLLKDFIPDETLKGFIRGVCQLLGIAFKVSGARRTIEFKFLDDIMSDTSSIEFSDNVIGELQLSPEYYNGFVFKVNPVDCKYIKDNYYSVDDLNIKGSVNSFDLLPEDGNQLLDAYFVNIWRAWFIWDYDPDTGGYGWIFHSVDYSTEIKETEEERGDPFQVELKLSTPAARVWDKEFPIQDSTVGAGFRLWHIPAFHVPGNFKMLPKKYKSKSVYALIPYWGLQKDNANENYPFASSDVYSYSRTKIDHANISLLPLGDYGLYEKKWKKFIQWRLQSPGEFKIMKQLSPLEISQLNWFRWYKIHGVDYLFQEVRFNIKNNRIGTAQIQAYRR